MSAGITRDDWLKALSNAGLANPSVDDRDAVTISEFAEMMGLPAHSAARRLRQLAALGKATRTSKRSHAADGRSMILSAYRLVTETPTPTKRAK